MINKITDTDTIWEFTQTEEKSQVINWLASPVLYGNIMNIEIHVYQTDEESAGVIKICNRNTGQA